jgi:hypothetical protein
MAVELRGKDFILDYQFGFDFCKVIDVTKCKAKYVYISYDGTNFLMHLVSDTLVAYGSSPLAGGKAFKMGVPALKLVALFKRLYPGSSIKLRPAKKELVIQEDNIKVKLAAVNYKAPTQFPEFSYIDGPECEWLVESISKCASALGDGKRFNGILIDNTSPSVGRIVNFTETAFRVCAAKKFSFGNYRMVISIDIAKALKSFSGSITHVMIAPGKMGAYLNSGICFFTPLMHDDLPVRYVDSFGLQEQLEQVDLSGRSYIFDKKRFAEVFEFVSSVIGAEESMIMCEVEGLSAGNQHPVWRLSAKTHNGCEASEQVESAAPGVTDMAPFRVNKKSTVDTLKYHKEEIVVLDMDDTFLVITERDAADVTLLLKAPV